MSADPRSDAVTAWAAGKAILTGEHAVVYGAPALAASLDRGAEAHALLCPSADSQLLLGDAPCLPGSEELPAYQRLLEASGVEGARTTVHLHLPAGVGLGASAAVGVAIARALRRLRNPRARDDDADVLSLAALWEDHFHGKASGLDAACAFSGSCIRFVRGGQPTPVVIAKPFTLIAAVVASAPPTRAMVASVAKRERGAPLVFAAQVAAIAELTGRAEMALADGNLPELGRVLDHNHELLQQWGVSTPALDRACAAARQAGALGAKLTGAGGGGCVIALSEWGGQEAVVSAWRAHGLDAITKQVQPN